MKLAGGGDFTQQQIVLAPPPEPPKQDNTLLWATGVLVPILVAVISAWAMRRKVKGD